MAARRALADNNGNSRSLPNKRSKSCFDETANTSTDWATIVEEEEEAMESKKGKRFYRCYNTRSVKVEKQDEDPKKRDWGGKEIYNENKSRIRIKVEKRDEDLEEHDRSDKQICNDNNAWIHKTLKSIKVEKQDEDLEENDCSGKEVYNESKSRIRKSLTSTPSKRATASSSKTDTAENKLKSLEHETDPEVLKRRQKQIDYGKNTLCYQRYLDAIPKRERAPHHPTTPKKYIKYSRRSWDTQIRIWRKRLHCYEFPSNNDDDYDIDLSDLASELSFELNESASSRSSVMSPVEENAMQED